MADPTDPTTPGAPGVPRKAPSRKARKKKAVTEARRTKEFTYRGLTLPELQALPLDEVSALLPSRARRYIKRCIVGQHDEVARKFWAKAQEAAAGEEVRTHLREFPVLPAMVGKIIAVHDGKDFSKVTIAPDMIGHKLGEFALTRKPVKHTGPGVGATRSSKFMPLK